MSIYIRMCTELAAMLLTFAFSMFDFVRAFAFSHNENKPDELTNLFVSCMRSSLDIITGWSMRVRSRADEELLSILRIGKHCTVVMLVKIAVITV